MAIRSRIKPSRWAFSPAFIAPKWGRFIAARLLSTPFWEKGGGVSSVDPRRWATEGLNASGSGKSWVMTPLGFAVKFTTGSRDDKLAITKPIDTNTATHPLKIQFPFTLEFIASSDNLTNGNAVYVTDNVLDKHTGIAVGFTASGAPFVKFGDDTGNGSADRRTHSGTVTVSTGEIAHVIWVCRSITDVDLYINGVKDGTSETGTATILAYSTSRCAYAGGKNTTTALIGKLILFNFSNFAWSASDAAQRFLDPFGPFRVVDEAAFFVPAVVAAASKPPSGLALLGVGV